MPIEGAAGVGYALRRGADLPPLMFTRAELEALVVGARLTEAFAGRLRRLSDLLDRSNSRRRPPRGDIKLRSGAAEHFNRIINHLPEAREAFQETMRYCAATNPRALRFIVLMMGIYIHLGPLSRHVIAAMDARIAAQDTPPVSIPPAAHEAHARAAF